MTALKGRSALVTGGGGGFGKACARMLARDSAAVTLMGRDPGKLDRARDLLLAAAPESRIALFPGDAADENAVIDALAATVAHGGGLDIVIGTVGGGSGYGPIINIDYDKFLSDYRTNVGTAFLLIKHGVPLMPTGGSFTFISSTAAQMPFQLLGSYCAAKAGLDHFVRTAANELGGQGIRVNSVRPGLTHTDGLDAAFARPGYVDTFLPLIPLGRTGLPDDVAGAVRFLAGPEAAWITGQSIAADGGNELRMAPLAMATPS